MEINKQIRICQIGCGEWGKNILRDLKTLDCHVTVVCRTETNQQKALRLGADKVTDNTANLTDIDGFIVATPTKTHAEIIQQIAHYNLPIFVEKPLSNDVNAAQTVTALIGDKLFVMDKWRYHPGIEILRKIVQEKSLGSVLGLQTFRYNWGNSHYGDVDGIWVLTPHDLSICLEILGHIPRPKFAVGTQWQEEAVGLIALLGDKPWVQINVSTVRALFQREVRLECSEGIAVLKDGYADYIEIYHRDQWNKQLTIEKISFTAAMPLFKELQAFVNYLRDGSIRPRSSAYEGLEIVRVIQELRTMAGIDNSANDLKNVSKKEMTSI